MNAKLCMTDKELDAITGASPYVGEGARTIEQVRAGDVLIDRDGDYRRVFAVVDYFVITSTFEPKIEDLPEEYDGNFYTFTKQELKKQNHKIHQPPQPDYDVDLYEELRRGKYKSITNMVLGDNTILSYGRDTIKQFKAVVKYMEEQND